MKAKISSLVLLTVWMAVDVRADKLIPLRAGPLTMMLDGDNAMLRYIRVGKHEVLRGINAPVRNQFWGTLSTDVSNLSVKRSHRGEAFTVTFDVRCAERDIDFAWKGRIVGTAKGVLTFTFEGEARTTFKKNRIGFCILHGPTAAGQKWEVEHTNGKKDPGKFPRFISPLQPAKDIRAVSHEVAPGMWATVRCEGDTFEMEDQRNWTDASFKTYCTPLAIPYPVVIKKGTKINHKVTVSLKGDVAKYVPKKRPWSASRITLRINRSGALAKPLPALGTQCSGQVDYLSGEAILKLQKLNLEHLRVVLRPGDNAAEILGRVQQQQFALGTKLRLVLELAEGKAKPQLDKVIAAIRQTKTQLQALQILAATTDRFAECQAVLAGANLGVPLGVAEDTNFTEINRNRPSHAKISIVSFGCNPQVHARDNLTMIETMSMQGVAVRSARQFIGKRRLYVGPITLKVQQVNQPPLPGQLSANEDVRQASSFAAAWTIGSYKYLAEAGVESVTYFETVGRKGLMAARNQVPSPAFPAPPMQVYPIYHALRYIADFRGGRVHPVSSSDDMSVVGLALSQGARTRLLLANLSDRSCSVHVHGMKKREVYVQPFDDSTIGVASRKTERFHARQGYHRRTRAGVLSVSVPAHGFLKVD